MTFLRRVLRVAAILALSLQPMQAQPATAQAINAEGRPVVVFAAASLQSAFNSIAAEWQRETGKRVTFSYAATSALARQIEQGAPADLFASADLEWMDWLQARSLIRTDTRRTMLGNTLVLIASRDQVAALKIAPGFPLAAALGDSRFATGNPQAVPVGRYAQAALTSLGVWDQVAPRIAGTENVRAALALVARGEAKFGIVYATDARTESRVRVVDVFPATSHPPILYPFAAAAASMHPDTGAFLAYLASPSAIRVFEAEGFKMLR